MTITVAQFRADFTAFASTTVFPNDGVNYWLSLAYLMLRPERWGPTGANNNADPPVYVQTVLDLGAELFTAHNLALEALSNKAAALGNVPGILQGAISGKSVDKVSVSYDPAAGLELDAGHWGLTLYGNRFKRLSNMAGMGGLQITGGCAGFGWQGGAGEGW